MTNNDILKRLRYAFDLSDFSVLEMTKNGGKEINPKDLTAYYRNEDEDGYKNCSNSILNSFLDGLILKKRGPKPDKTSDQSGGIQKTVNTISVPENNNIMKKLKIALKLKDDDIVEIFKSVDLRFSKSEINALFRRPAHKNFRECGDQILRNFIMGITNLYREPHEHSLPGKK